jgi:hypothetical protein
MKIFTIILAVVFCSSLQAQFQLGGVDQTSGSTIYVNSGTITDDNDGSGGCGTCYNKDKNYTLTICPRNFGDVVKLSFTVLDIETGSGMDRSCKDQLYLYQNSAAQPIANADDIYCGTLTGAALPTIISTHESGCVTLQFVSDGNGQQLGFSFTVSNITPCKNPTARIVSAATPYYVCPSTALNPTAQPLSFDGSTSTVACTQDYSTNANDNIINDATELSQNITALAGGCYHNDPSTTPLHTLQASGYDWNWGDGTLSTGVTATQTHTFNTPGVYSVTLRVRDNNTDMVATGCESANEAKRIVYVVPPPTRNSPTLTLNCSTAPAGPYTGSLTGTASSVTEVEALPVVTTTPTLLPDGNGASYINSVNYGGYFPTGQTMSSACYPTITFSLEHSWAGDLYIDLVAPNGQYVRLFNRVGTQNHFGLCSNASNTDAAGGCPATYTVVPSGGVAWPAAGNATYTTTTSSTCANFAGPCEAAYYIRPGFNYAPSSPFTAINGAPMNGAWSLRITDNQSLDNGKLFNWTISFPAACFKTLNEISPIQNTLVWSNGNASTSSTDLSPAPGDPCPTGSTCDGNTRTSVSNLIGPYASAGTHTFNYTVTDQYTCQWPGTGTVNVTCLLPIELVNFAAQNLANSVRLLWNVQSESNNDFYSLYRSKNGIDYENLGRIDSKVNGFSSELTSYEFIDEKPYSGLTYYKLKQTDFNGTTKTVDEITNSRSGLFLETKIYPNPVEKQLDVDFVSEIESKIDIKIFDSNGKIVVNEKRTVYRGINSLKFDMSAYNNGLYIIELDANEDSFRSKFSKM